MDVVITKSYKAICHLSQLNFHITHTKNGLLPIILLYSFNGKGKGGRKGGREEEGREEKTKELLHVT